MDTLIQDARLALRSLRRTPGFTFIAILCLALGTGATAAIYTVVSAVLLRPLPYPQPEQLVRVYEAQISNAGFFGSVSPANFIDWQRQNSVFDQLVAYQPRNVNLQSGATPERLSAVAATGDLFRMLRTGASIGRTFTPEEAEGSDTHVAVLSDVAWRTRFGADRSIVGRTVTLDGERYTIVGVMPPDFSFPATSAVDVWLPRPFTPDELMQRGNHYLSVVGRLKAGTTLDAALTQMKQVAARLAIQYPDEDGTRTVKLYSMRDSLFGKNLRTQLYVLLGASVLVLLIACVNVANLLLARAAMRRREVAVRAALGAGAGRLARQFLTESVLLSLLGAAAGVLVAYGGVRGLLALASRDIPRAHPIGIDAGVFAFLAAVAVVTGIAFGLVPALHGARVDPRDNLADGSRGGSIGRAQQRYRAALVATEIALSLVLLVGAALLMKAFIVLENTPSGITTDHVITFHISVSGDEDAGGAGTAFYQPALDRLSALPGVTAAGITSLLPLQDYWWNAPFSIEGRPPAERGKEPVAEIRAASAGYFSALRIPVLEGRNFTEQDAAGAPQVMLVNSALAKRYFPGEDPIGQRLQLDSAMVFAIVGVVGDTRGAALDQPPMPEFYIPYRQLGSSLPSEMTFTIRTEVPPASVMPAIREAIRSVDPTQPLFRVETMDEVVSLSLSSHRLYMWLLGTFAVIALALATAGIYGVTSYLVTQRTREMGIRLALGARPASLKAMVVRQEAVVALVGTIVGLVGAFAVTRLLSSFLYGVSATDPVTYLSVAAALVIIAVLASYVPARRATRVDPTTALRAE
ncbi:MAG TPA: ABC transporter permease [Gemmatimonadaceae bacterium]|nr:ABC transporter permease [Gemmatimonadaceae bacterium]